MNTTVTSGPKPGSLFFLIVSKILARFKQILRFLNRKLKTGFKFKLINDNKISSKHELRLLNIISFGINKF